MADPFAILRKAGPLRNGAERGHGSVWHLVPHDKPEIWMTACNGVTALCGAFPSIQWSSEEGDTVTCPRCCRKLDLIKHKQEAR